jgi:Domain of Unknown Function (DUF748)
MVCGHCRLMRSLLFESIWILLHRLALRPRRIQALLYDCQNYVAHAAGCSEVFLDHFASALWRVLCSRKLRVSETATRWYRIVIIGAGLIATTAALFLLALNLLLRHSLEHAINEYTTTHHISLGYAHFELLARRLILRDVTIFQNSHPSPPIIHLTEAQIGIRWLSLLHGQIEDCVIITATVHLSQPQLKTEAANLENIRRVLLKAPNLTIYKLRIFNFNSIYLDSNQRIETKHLSLLAYDLRHDKLSIPGPRERAASKMPEPAFSMAQLQITGGPIVYCNVTPNGRYLVTLNDLSFNAFNLNNLPQGKPTRFKLEALLMSTGRISAEGQIQLSQVSRNLSLSFNLSGLELHSLNPVFRHYGHAEAASGQLSVRSQLFVRANQSTGFIRIMVGGLEIQADPNKGRPSVAHRIIRSAVEATGKLLSVSHPSEPVRVDLSSTIDARSSLFGLGVQLAHKALIEGFEPSFKGAAQRR